MQEFTSIRGWEVVSSLLLGWRFGVSLWIDTIARRGSKPERDANFLTTANSTNPWNKNLGRHCPLPLTARLRRILIHFWIIWIGIFNATFGFEAYSFVHKWKKLLVEDEGSVGLKEEHFVIFVWNIRIYKHIIRCSITEGVFVKNQKTYYWEYKRTI